MDIGPRQLRMTLTYEEAFGTPLPRRTLCPSYEGGLDYAADRFWTSFTCRGCYMEKLILLGKLKELHPPKVNVVQVMVRESTMPLIQYH